MELNTKLAKVGLVTGGLVAGVVLAGTIGAQASSPSPVANSGSTATTTAEDPHPGDNGADGVPETQEHHDGRPGGGHGLELSGTVAAVGTDSITIDTAGGRVVYAVNSSSDIDKNGEGTLKALVVGDAVRFSVEGTTKTIDKLHAGNEAMDRPSHDAPAGADTTTAPAA